MDLNDWHRRLEDHFRRLCEQRGGWPLFALEHGLTSEELEELNCAIRAWIAARRPQTTQRYAWIVYASEFGYRYSGESYWPAFERETPGWVQRGERTWLRKAFRDFAAAFKGAEPHGPWAQHFSIICWPITHGILPTDLQRQLVKLLFDFRGSFTSATFSSAEALGRHIHALSQYGSARFQEFAQNEVLLGQISAALLMGSATDTPLLAPATLKRILADIDRESTAGEWLREAQARVGRLNVRGLGSLRDRRSHAVPAQGSDRRLTQLAAIRLELELFARPRGVDSWEAWIQFPSFVPVASMWPKVGAYLERVRPLLVVNDPIPLARGWLLAGNRQIRLKEWPTPGGRCLEFEEPPKELSLVVNAIRFPSGEPLVLRIQEDGEAVAVRSGTVGAGERYLVLSRKPLTSTRPELHAASIACAGIFASVLEVPHIIDDDLERWLKANGIAVSKSLKVWAVGPVPAAWDDNGYCESLVGDPLIIAVSADYPVAQVTATLEGGTRLDVKGANSGSPFFLYLPALEEGAHELILEAAGTTGTIAAGKLRIVCRVPGATGRTEHSGEAMLLSCVPRVPTLEAMWQGQVEVALLGPAGRSVECTLSLLDRGRTRVQFERQLPSLKLPVTARAWQEYWNAHVLAREDILEQYDLASACRVTWDAGAVGRQSIVCDRTVAPLRWAVSRANDGMHARLLDDREDGPLKIEFFSFERPAESTKLLPSSCAEGWNVPAVGGLLHADGKSWSATVIVSPALVFRDFQSLELNCEVQPWIRQHDALNALLQLIELWSRAEIRGSALGPPRRARAVACLVSECFSTIGGDRWRKAEQALGGNLGALPAVSATVIDPELARQIVEQAQTTAREDMLVRVQALEAICRKHLPAECLRVSGRQIANIRPGVRRRIDQVKWLCEFVLRLSEHPAGVREWAGQKLGMGFEMLIDVPAIARSGRLFAIWAGYARD